LTKAIVKLGVISALVLAFCGWGALGAMWQGIGEVFAAFFPFIVAGAKQSIEDYLTSPYFIAGVIMFILSSGFGIWVGRTGGKAIYLVVSIVAALISLVSIGANIL
jgi:hypothetical protein